MEEKKSCKGFILGRSLLFLYRERGRKPYNSLKHIHTMIKDKGEGNQCNKIKDIAKEDKTLHKRITGDPVCREWFHYESDFDIKGDILTLVLGFPRSSPGLGVLGWVSFKGNQYSLDGNPQQSHYGFFNLETYAEFTSNKGYTLKYCEKVPEYTGSVKGEFPEYRIDIKNSEFHIDISMRINSQKSLYCRSWIGGCWFHSGDLMVEGTINGKDMTPVKGKGWYERNWDKILVLGPSEWFWFMSHLDNGDVFDLLIEKTLGVRILFLDECWLYSKEKFHKFPCYDSRIPFGLRKAILKKDYSNILGKKIHCRVKSGMHFNKITAIIEDFRQYEYVNKDVRVKWANFIIKTEGEIIDGEPINMAGRGVAEWARITYWKC